MWHNLHNVALSEIQVCVIIICIHLHTYVQLHSVSLSSYIRTYVYYCTVDFICKVQNLWDVISLHILILKLFNENIRTLTTVDSTYVLLYSLVKSQIFCSLTVFYPTYSLILNFYNSHRSLVGYIVGIL